ncbi:hypothetical protein KQX54_004133 [Cotesia glomerata]|uniref:Uncharacterized protein n=1 Tax=Cotesia glomerata TaxID=32391 RepID=A0AAV7IIX6_COTGL|nr:hypothetical protein KQX54_004133 [Cotesia glomerata]
MVRINKKVQSAFKANKLSKAVSKRKSEKICANVNSALLKTKIRGFTPLHLAVLRNHLDCARFLLENGASVFATSSDLCLPLHIAVLKNHVEMADLLLAHGAEVNLQFTNNIFKLFRTQISPDSWKDHNLPLIHFSILQKSTEMTFLLLEYGVNHKIKTALEKTTLMQAVEITDYEMVKFLLVEGEAGVNERDIFGQPVLHFIVVNSNRKLSMYS